MLICPSFGENKWIFFGNSEKVCIFADAKYIIIS